MSDTRLAPPINGAELRLELMLEELRAIRAELHQSAAPSQPVSGQVELREPRVLGRSKPRG